MIKALADVMLYRGIPENIRSNNGPEFVAEELRKWLAKVGTGTLYIEPGSPYPGIVGYCFLIILDCQFLCSINGVCFPKAVIYNCRSGKGLRN